MSGKDLWPHVLHAEAIQQQACAIGCRRVRRGLLRRRTGEIRHTEPCLRLAEFVALARETWTVIVEAEGRGATRTDVEFVELLREQMRSVGADFRDALGER